MKIVQIVPKLNARDAVGNDALAIDDVLRQAGYHTELMTMWAHESLRSRAREMSYQDIEPTDLAFLHSASWDSLIRRVSGLACRKGIIYHNMTPAKYYVPYSIKMSANLMLGRVQIRRYAPKVDFAWGDSSYNCSELVRYGVDESKVSVLPILFDESQASIVPDADLLAELQAITGAKLLFIGRIAPNKKQEDVIRVYAHVLQRDPQARLYIVGSWQGTEKYFARLKKLCAHLDLTEDQVVFTGSVSDEEKEAYLEACDVLVCMSEHEGFCIPLIEAMRHNMPVVAYAAAAVPETLGNNGLLFETKDFEAIAQATVWATHDLDVRQRVLQRQQEQLGLFSNANAQQKLLQLVHNELQRIAP